MVTRAIAIVLLLASQAFAANKTSYVKAGCANNGDGTTSSCASSGGAAGAWNTCSAMVTGEVAANADLVSGLNGILTVNFSSNAGAEDTTTCTIDGFTTDSTHYLKLVGDRTSGVWDDAAYHLEANESSGSGLLRIGDADVWIDKFQIYNTGTGSGGYVGVKDASGGTRLKVTNTIFRNGACNIGGGGYCLGLWFNPSVANCSITAINNISYFDQNGGGVGSANYNVDCGGNSNNGATVIFLNNLGYRGNNGMECNANGSSDTIDLENNIMQNNATAGYAAACASGTYTTATRNTNISEDTTAPGTTYDSQSVDFTSETSTSEDFRLAASETGAGSARDNGTTLTSAFTTAGLSDVDFEGTVRPQGSAWDIGPDEAAAAGVNALTILQAIGAL